MLVVIFVQLDVCLPESDCVSVLILFAIAMFVCGLLARIDCQRHAFKLSLQHRIVVMLICELQGTLKISHPTTATNQVEPRGDGSRS